MVNSDEAKTVGVIDTYGWYVEDFKRKVADLKRDGNTEYPLINFFPRFRSDLLEDTDLSGIDLSGLDVTQISFRGTDLSRANLQRMKATRVNFEGANISEADLKQSGLKQACFDGVEGYKADFGMGVEAYRPAILPLASFRNASLEGAIIGSMYMKGVDFHGTYCS